MIFKAPFALWLLVLSCVTFAADPTWEPWGSSDDGNWYTLKGSLEYDSGVATIWAMKDLKKPLRATDGTVYKSMRIQYKYDCAAKSEKTIYVKGYSDQMGYGVEIFSDYVGYSAKPTVYSASDWDSRGYAKYCKRIWEVWK